MSDDDLSIPDFLRRKPGDRPPAPAIAATPVVFPESFPEYHAPSTDAEPSIGRPYTKIPSRPASQVTAAHLRASLSAIEGMIDDVMYAGAEPFSVYNHLLSLDSPTAVGRDIVSKYKPYLDELQAVQPGCDAQLWEGYSQWKRADLNKLIDLVSAIIDDAARYVGNKRAVRLSPRKHRQPKAQRQIRNLKYRRDHGELKLASLDPLKIIGAMTLWTYDVKRKLLCMYVSNSRTGFMVRGTTLQCIDKEASVCKVLRKPQESLTALLSANKAGALALINDLTTKASVPNGRINDNTVLLRIL